MVVEFEVFMTRSLSLKARSKDEELRISRFKVGKFRFGAIPDSKLHKLEFWGCLDLGQGRPGEGCAWGFGPPGTQLLEDAVTWAQRKTDELRRFAHGGTT